MESPGTAKIEAAFAAYFATFGITLPRAAVVHHADGELHARGWSIRWRWRDDALEFRALHRMTNERWELIGADGTRSAARGVPAEMMVVPDDAAELSRARADYQAAWAAHRASVTRDGMGFGDPPSADGHNGQMTWKLDGAPAWHTTALTDRDQP